MEIRESLEANFLTCKICQEILQQPKVLECMHSFCLGCLDEIVRKAKENIVDEDYNSKFNGTTTASTYQSSYTRSKYSRKYSSDTREISLKCAVCSKRTLVPRAGCVSLPDDLLAGKLASIVGRIPKYPTCDVCSIGGPSITSPFANNFLEQVNMCKSDRSGGEGASSSDMESSENENTAGTRLSVDSYRMSYRKKKRDRTKKKSRILSSNGIRNSSLDPKSSLQDEKTTAGVSRESSSTSQGKEDSRPRRAEAACIDCAKRLCAVCQVTHSNMPVTAEHILIKVEQLEDMKCHRHQREIRRFYCKTCEICICLVCTFDSAEKPNHSDHEILSLKQAVDSYQHEIDENSSLVQMNVEKLERILDGIRICDVHLKSVTMAIDERAEEMCQAIRQRQSDLKQEIDKRLSLRSQELSEKYENINTSIETWYELTREETFTQRLDLMNPLEALDEALPMLEKIKTSVRETDEHCEPDNVNWSNFYQQLLTPPKSRATVDGGGTQTTNNHIMMAKGVLKKKKVSFKLDYEEPPSLEYWTEKIGKFFREPSRDILSLGRVMTPLEHDEELKDAERRRLESRKSFALQCNYYEENQCDQNHQTDVNPGVEMKLRIDNGTQYQSSDINAPVSFFRGGKQIVVQK